MRRSALAALVLLSVSSVSTLAAVLLAAAPSTSTTPTSPETTLSVPAASQDSNPQSGTASSRASLADVPALTSDPDAKRLYDQILACFPPSVTEFYDLFEKAPCYEKLVIDAAKTYEPADLLNAVKAMVATRPDVLTACHNGGHSAASALTRRIWDPAAAYETQLAQMRIIMSEADDVCQNGFVHGFYDAIGQASPTDDSFKAAAEVCYEVASETVDCGHGLGHSAWYATKDFKRAAEICGVFTEQYRYRCDDGVIMYLPDYWSSGKGGWTADPRSEAFDPDKFYADAVAVCSWWPSTRANDPEPLRGCWTGIVAGVLWRPISTLLDYGNYPEIAAEAKALLRRAEAACMQFPPAGEEYCIKEWPGMVIYVAQNNEDYIADLCSGMIKYQDRCTADSVKQLRSNLARDTETSRTKG